MTVYQVLVGAEINYPRIDFSSPRNQFDSLELAAFMRGEIESGPYDIAVQEKRRRPLGALSISPGYVAVPPQVAAAFIETGAPLVLRPIRVNGREYVSMSARAGFPRCINTSGSPRHSSTLCSLHLNPTVIGGRPAPSSR